MEACRGRGVKKRVRLLWIAYICVACEADDQEEEEADNLQHSAKFKKKNFF